MNQKGFSHLFIFLGIILIIVIAGGAYYLGKTQIPKPQPQNSIVTSQIPQPTSTPDETTTWKTYINKGINLTFNYPPNWDIKELNDDGEIDGVDISGLEGKVHAAWGTGFGGGCDPSEHINFQILGEMQNICHGVSSNGVESWNQIYKKLSPTMTFSMYAQANAPYKNNRNAILTILSTFKFLDQNQTSETTNWKTYTNSDCKYSIAFPNDYKTLSDLTGNTPLNNSNELYSFTPDTQYNKLGGWPTSGLEFRVNCVTDSAAVANEDPQAVQKAYPNVIIDKSYVFPALPFPNGLYNWSISGWAYYKPERSR